MGRPKLILKPIPNGRDRDLALTRRKKMLIAKMSQFSEVCGVKACMIMYDGNNGDAPPLTWPEDPIEVNSIIERYESIKNEKLPKNFDLNNFFEIRKNMVDIEIFKVQKETLKIKYPTWRPSFDNLGVEELTNLIARLDMKLQACNQQVEMSKYKHYNEASFNFMVQSESAGAAPNTSQLNFMQGLSQNQFCLAPMAPLDGNKVASYLLNLEQGSSSQSQILNFDPNLMQLTAMNNIANQVDALGNSTDHQLDVPVDLTDKSLQCFSQLDEIVNCVSQPGDPINWTNQPGVPVIGGSTSAIHCNSATTDYATGLFHQNEHNNPESLLCNYNGAVQSMQPGYSDTALQNISTLWGNVPVDEFQTVPYNNKLQDQYSNHII